MPDRRQREHRAPEPVGHTTPLDAPAALPEERAHAPWLEPHNPSAAWHRLARHEIEPGGNHGNHGLSSRDRTEPRVMRATHVEVGRDSWRFLRAEAIRWHLPLSTVVGRLVCSAVAGGVPLAADGGSVERGRRTGRRATAFTRLYGVSDEVWTAFKAQAAEAGVTVARAVGVLVESAAAEVARQSEVAEPSREIPRARGIEGVLTVASGNEARSRNPP